MERLDPFDVSVEGAIDYDKLIREFGTKPISTVKQVPDLREFRRGFVFSHRDFDKYLQRIKEKKKVSIVSGFNASGSLHLGHKLTFDVVLGLQKLYKIPVYVPLTDDESYVTGKVKDQAEGLKNAKLIASQVMAMGFDPKLTKIFVHQQYTKIYNLAVKLSKKCTLSEIRAIYGFNDSTNPGLFFYPLLQAADILLPQELEGNHMTLVPVAIDQDPHIRFTRDLAERIGFEKPATIHLRFLSGLKGGKMSKSREGSAIFLNEEPKKAAKFCMNALTGGRATAEEQRKLGADPEKSVVLEYLSAHFIEDDRELSKLTEDYRKGRILDGEMKKMLSERVESFLTDFQSKVSAEQTRIDQYLLKEPQ
jgi:tryptophanyl-tRNA synthetase